MTYPGKFGEVCMHGSLMRCCEVCELDDRIDKLKALLKECREMLDLEDDPRFPELMEFRARLDAEIEGKGGK